MKRMFRRVVSLSLLPCLLLTQSAALGHSHCDARSTGHDPRPHFHARPTSAGHEHAAHHHGHEKHDHPHGADDLLAGPHALTPAEPHPDHDSSAVYVADLDTALKPRTAADEPGASALWATIGLFASADPLWETQPRSVAIRTSPAPPSGHACPLYVRHLALLI